MTSEELLFEAYGLPYGEARTILLERAVKEAEAEGDPERLFDARLALTGAYQHGGEPGKSFAVFSRNVAALDAEPGRYGREAADTLLWHFKWIAGDTRSFPEVPLRRALDVLDDMERRYVLAGHGPHAVHAQRSALARHLGDREQAEHHYRLWCTTPRDELSDCVGCDPSGKVAHLVWLGRDEEAVELAAPVLAGELTCTEQPQDILTELLLPYLRTGRHAEAAAAHQRAYRIIAGKVHNLAEIGRHLEFCALSGNESRGLEILERELPLLDRAPSPRAALEFTGCAALLLRRLAELGHPDPRAAGLEARARELAARFDTRNGTGEQGALLEARLAAEPIAEYVPLVPHARRPTPQPPAPVVRGGSPQELMDAAHQAWERGDVEGALAAWERYDAVGGPLTARRLDGLGLAAAVQGDREAAERHWRAAAEQHEDPAEGQASLGRVAQLTGDRELAERVHAYLSEYGTPRQRGGSLRRMARMLAQDGSVREAAALLEGQDDGGALLLLAQVQGEYAPAQALETARRACRALKAEGAAVPLAEAAMLLAYLIGKGYGGDLDELLAAYGDALAVRGEPRLRALAHAARGEVLLGIGRGEEAAEDLIEAVALFTAVGERERAAFTRADLASAYLDSGRPAEAAVAAEEALAMIDPEETEALNQARWARSHALHQLGDVDVALEGFQELVSLYPTALQSARAADMAARLLDQVDRDEEAARYFALAAERYREDDPETAGVMARRAALSSFWGGDPERALAISVNVVVEDPFEQAVVLYDRARYLAALGREGEALRVCGEAVERFEALGAEDAVATARDLLRQLES
ncbi:hypothetical protein [Nonomuraea sp. NPDC050310]|uniref:hypothetical protein n=1 Tax=Nonomuraea sp. NPDC050310 TaxID=3154935 RepID=UPI0033CE5831